MIQTIENELNAHILIAQQTLSTLTSQIQNAANLAIDTLKRGNKILIFGNGGSAADAQHIAAELTGRYKTERKSLPAIALTTDTSALTAIGNDYGYDRVFDRQLEGLASHGDLAFGISTSGNSTNVINALTLAKSLGCVCIGMSGRDGGKMRGICDVDLIVPSNDTARIQEMHITIGHIICQLIDDAYKV